MQAKKHERVRISKRGNSYMITIPKAIAEAIQIEKIKIAEIFLKDEHTISVKV
jgi:antitoxin component of MazEF toxin-antitoxin module